MSSQASAKFLARRVPSAKPPKPTREALLAALAERDRELTEARERQTATAEVLRVISQSPTDAQPVFESIVLTAVRLLHCGLAAVLLCDGGFFYPVAEASGAGLRRPKLGKTPIDPGDNFPSRAIVTKERLYLPDWSRIDLPEHERRARDVMGVNSALYLPLLRQDECFGLLALIGERADMFGPSEIALAEAFRDQAGIAIENARQFKETKEALQQQTATAEVLKVISRSAFNLKSVLTTLVDSARRLCDAPQGMILLRDGDVFRTEMQLGYSPEFERFILENPIVPSPYSGAGRAALTGEVAHFPDVQADPDYRLTQGIRLGGYRAMLSIPLKRENDVVGVFSLGRPVPGAFTQRQIDLVQTFADQAVIAIENVRLFDEVQARTRDLSEALERQTATAEVLKVISRSVFDLDTVLQTLIDTAVRLTLGSRGTIFIRHGDVLVASAFHRNVPAPLRAYLATTTWRLDGDSHMARAAREGRVVHISDLSQSDRESDEETRKRAAFGAGLWAPLMRDGQAIGVFGVPRDEPIAFSDREIELVQTFADQAVIAIENSRLFEQLKAKTHDLSEALQQQTATADVLKVISRSAFDLQAVLDALVQSAANLCDADQACVFKREGDLYHWVSNFGFSPELVAYAGAHPFAAGPGSTTSRVALEGRAIHNPDVLADPNYVASEYQRLGNYRTMLGVPLLREGSPIGVFILTRQRVRPFTDRQIELVQSFADQAVIAIENVRLFDEVQAKTRDLSESLQQQTATADVLKVISRSAFDLQAVFDTLIASAVELCGANRGAIFLRDGDVFRLQAASTSSPEYFHYWRAHPAKAGRGSATARVIRSGKVESIPDVLEDAEMEMPTNTLIQIRATLGVPLLRDNQVEGVLVLTRPQPGVFTPRQVDLVQTFADQAVIAIENARLFNEVKARTDDLSEALQQQTATADVLKVISRSAFDLDAVLQTLVESAARLCNAPQGVIHLREGDVVRAKAMVGHSGELMQRLRDTPRRAGRESIVPRVMLSGRVEHIDDALTDPEFDLGGMDRSKLGFSGLLGVPLLRKGKVEGVFVVSKPQPGRFTDRQTELVQTFADQAVIAIENVRLFNEVQSKTDDLMEALQQQTATADVLKVISRSAFNLQAVLDTLVESAYRLSGAAYGLIYLKTGEHFECKAIGGMGAEEGDALFKGRPIRAGRSTAAERVIATGEIQSIPDLFADPEFDPKIRAAIQGSVDSSFASLRSLIAVPMKRDDAVVGVIVIARAQSGLLPARQLELLQTFADQAVIAIENARLFDEVQARTHDLSEALQQQTATADVLKVISRSAFDLQAVFDTLIASAVELCGAYSGVICVRDGDVFRYRGSAGDAATPGLLAYLAEHPATPGRGSIAGRVLLSGKVEAIPDRIEDPEFAVPMGPLGHAARALMGVPLLGKAGTEGALVLTRKEPGQFTDRQIEIVQTFADQAVIAIENVRLFDEVQARTRELAASLDDLRKTQDRLIQSEKLASLGQLTAGIAHEIKNPLNFVNNFSALSRELIDELAELLEKAPLKADQRDEAGELIGMVSANLEKVVQHGKRADSIVKNMLLHSREGSGERSSVKVNAMVEEALNLAYHGARAEKPGFNVTIVKSLAADAGAADLYAQEMTRVLLNLISNGFYATTKRRQGEANGAYEPTITASTRDLGDSVEIAIRDNGIGIPEEVKAKMFNPFFTTKPAGEGTGLGLSLSHDIVVKQHGGTLEVATEPGTYTLFTIVLPRDGATS
jgi:two-component system, NtrC family, sensor kinase